ncbi:MAG: aminoacyl-tRNA hydrolase [bacterium]
MKLVVGLGNPGKDFAKTWHNLGFIALDEFKKTINGSGFKLEKKFHAEISNGKIGDEKIVLAKPQTFMNESGQAVSTITSYYKITPDNIIIIQDDIDLPLTKMRLSRDSSAGGHNGIKSIIEHLGTQNFIRIKLGIKTNKTAIMGTINYVLASFNKTEEKIIREEIKKAASAATQIITDGLTSAMNQYN